MTINFALIFFIICTQPGAVLTFLVLFTFTCINLADAFMQNDLQMRTIEAVNITIGQQYASAMTVLSLS